MALDSAVGAEVLTPEINLFSGSDNSLSKPRSGLIRAMIPINDVKQKPSDINQPDLYE